MKVKNFILNEPWTVDIFNSLNLSQFQDSEIKLFTICKKLVQQNKEISALNIFKEGDNADVVLYISLCNEIDKEKLKKEYRCQKKTKR